MNLVAQRKYLCVQYLIRILVAGIRRNQNVDETIKALLDKLDTLERQKTSTERDIAAIKRALSMIGVSAENRCGESPRVERRYVNDQPFHNRPLAEACLQIIVDHQG